MRFVMLVSILSCFVSGCPSVADYHTNEHLISELGVDEARQQLRTIFFRAVEPKIISVTIDNETLYYRYQQTIRGGFGRPIGRVPSENLLAFANISRVKVFKNHFIYVYGAAGQIIAQILLATDHDAKQAADLLMSFHAYHSTH